MAESKQTNQNKKTETPYLCKLKCLFKGTRDYNYGSYKALWTHEQTVKHDERREELEAAGVLNQFRVRQRYGVGTTEWYHPRYQFAYIFGYLDHFRVVPPEVPPEISPKLTKLCKGGTTRGTIKLNLYKSVDFIKLFTNIL